MSVPNFCKGCGKRLEGMEREVCSAKECLNFMRSTAMRLEPGNLVMSRENLIQVLEQDVRMADENAGLTSLLREVRVYPWDDCSKFVARRDACLAKKPRHEDPPQPMGMYSDSVEANIGQWVVATTNGSMLNVRENPRPTSMVLTRVRFGDVLNSTTGVVRYSAGRRWLEISIYEGAGGVLAWVDSWHLKKQSYDARWVR